MLSCRESAEPDYPGIALAATPLSVAFQKKFDVYITSLSCHVKSRHGNPPLRSFPRRIFGADRQKKSGVWTEV